MQSSNLLSLKITSKTRNGSNLSTFWFLPFLFLLSLNVCQAEESEEMFEHIALKGHEGIFRELPWTNEEIRAISSLHATAEYDRLMTLVKDKLVEVADDLRPETRRKIERFLITNRPPSVMRHFYDEHERKQIRQLHRNNDFEAVWNIQQKAFRRLPTRFCEEVLQYMNLPNSPKTCP